jgi:hypothetical protein
MNSPAGTNIFKHVYFADDHYFRWGTLKFICTQWCEIMQSKEIEKFVNFQIFLSSALIFYKERPGYSNHSSINCLKMPTSLSMNTNEKMFDLSVCGVRANGINISIGYRNTKSLEAKPRARLNIWMALGHEIEKELKGEPVGVHETRLAEWRAKLHVGLYEVDDDWSAYQEAEDSMIPAQYFWYPWQRDLSYNSWQYPKSLISMLPNKHYKRLMTIINNDWNTIRYLEQYCLQIKPTYLPLNRSDYTLVCSTQPELIPDEEEAYKDFVDRISPPTESIESISPSTSDSDDEDYDFPLVELRPNPDYTEFDFNR